MRTAGRSASLALSAGCRAAASGARVFGRRPFTASCARPRLAITASLSVRLRDHGPPAQAPRTEAAQEGRFSQLEAGCEPQRDQGHAPLSYPGQRRLPQVQQTVRFPPLLRPPSISSPRARPVPREDGGPASEQALRHGCAQQHRQAERYREQAHGGCVLPTAPGGRIVHVEDGRDCQRRRKVHRAGACPRRTGYDYGPCISRHSAHGRLRHLGRYVKTQAHYHAVQRRARRLRSVVNWFCRARPDTLHCRARRSSLSSSLFTCYRYAIPLSPQHFPHYRLGSAPVALHMTPATTHRANKFQHPAEAC